MKRKYIAFEAVSFLSRGFTLIELLVVMSIVSMLVALLLPALQQAREAARQVACASNLRQVGMARMTYAADSGGWIRGYGGGIHGWVSSIPPYLGLETYQDMKRTLACPSREANRFYYGNTISLRAMKDSDLYFYSIPKTLPRGSASLRLFHGESMPRPGLIDGSRDLVQPFNNGQAPNANLWYEHTGDNTNVLFLDQHIKSMKDIDIPQWRNRERTAGGWLAPEGSSYVGTLFWSTDSHGWVRKTIDLSQ